MQKTRLLDINATKATLNEGLRAYLLKVYQLMGLGLLVSALTAYLGTTPAFMRILFAQTPQGITYSFIGLLVIFSPLVLVFMFRSAIVNLNPAKAQVIFWSFSALMGFSFSVLLLAFTAQSVFQTFIATSGAFGALCLYGYTTRRDLSGLGSFMCMGLVGLLIAMFLNFFMHSSAVSYAVSMIGVVIFAGLTAYDTQRIRQLYNETDTTQLSDVKAISGALALYLDFVNLFTILIRFTGDRR